MWPYFVMFLLPAFIALNAGGSGNIGTARLRKPRLELQWVYAWLLLTVLIGFRYRVGGDWGTYLIHYANVRGLDISQVLAKPDPGYQLLNWLASEMDLGVFGVNLVGGAFFAWGLIAFCRIQPRPWLALAVAIPYLVVVVAMGYSRQGIALGLAMLGLVALSKGSSRKFAAWVLFGATFHKSAVLLLPIAALAASHNRYWTYLWIGVTAVVAAQLFVAQHAEQLIATYVEAEYQSQGALVRLLMNALPAAILLIWRRRFIFADSEGRLWKLFAIGSLAFVALFAVTNASTALDRLALYFLPLQLVVFSRLPGVFSTQVERNQTAVALPDLSSIRTSKEAAAQARALIAAVLLYYGAVQVVWLNYATHSIYWLPYRFYPLDDAF